MQTGNILTGILVPENADMAIRDASLPYGFFPSESAIVGRCLGSPTPRTGKGKSRLVTGSDHVSRELNRPLSRKKRSLSVPKTGNDAGFPRRYVQETDLHSLAPFGQGIVRETGSGLTTVLDAGNRGYGPPGPVSTAGRFPTETGIPRRSPGSQESRSERGKSRPATGPD